MNTDSAAQAVQELDIKPDEPTQEQTAQAESEATQEQETTLIPDEPKSNPEEEYARSKGWRPRDEWDESKGDWIDAGEFNRRGPLFENISKLKDEIRDYKKTTDALIDHNKKIEESTRKKVLKELEAERMAAVQDGDVEKFQEIDEQILEHKSVPEPQKQPTNPNQPNVDPAIIQWQEKNSWFDKDMAMTSYMIDQQRRLLGQGYSVADALNRAETAVKSEFAHKFQNPNKDKPSPVAGKQDQQVKKSYSITDLPADYRPVYQAIARKTDMPLSEYIEQLKSMGEMK